MDKKRALVAMSGGVDSAAAALLLQNSGYNITGITMRLWNENFFLNKGSINELDENSIQAKEIADKLNFEHFSVDMSSCFNDSVVASFINDYKSGKTPNPCVECNKKLKFGENIIKVTVTAEDKTKTTYKIKVNKNLFKF